MILNLELNSILPSVAPRIVKSKSDLLENVVHLKSSVMFRAKYNLAKKTLNCATQQKDSNRMDSSQTKDISDQIYNNLKSKEKELSIEYNSTKDQIGFFYVDDLLPKTLAAECFKVFPDKSEMRCLKSMREFKFVSAQMDKHDVLLEAVIYAFQHPNIVRLIGDICGVSSLYADESLYAGGISLMAKDNFLNPHLDNSHDIERERWRVLNLLYYVTPDWETKNGGHLEIWPNGPKKNPY